MAFTFGQVVNKLQSGKNMTHPGMSPKYLLLPLNTDYILLCDPNNSLNPASIYKSKISDLVATDWIELVNEDV